MDNKTCPGCSTEKPLTDFYCYKGKPYSYCKTCHNAKTREYEKNNRARANLYARKSYKKNKDKISERLKILRKERDPRILRQMSLFNKRRRERYRTDPVYRSSVNVRNRILDSLKYFRSYKCSTTRRLIGCDYYDFKNYIQSRFTKDMNWENQGSYWHIDHIVPCACWDLSDEKQQLACFNFRNLRPLRATDNCSKRATPPVNYQELKQQLLNCVS